jgi:hypothetical protein
LCVCWVCQEVVPTAKQQQASELLIIHHSYSESHTSMPDVITWSETRMIADAEY